MQGLISKCLQNKNDPMWFLEVLKLSGADYTWIMLKFIS